MMDLFQERRMPLCLILNRLTYQTTWRNAVKHWDWIMSFFVKQKFPKKAQTVDPRELSNREKTQVIGALKTICPLHQLMKTLRMVRSSY